MNLSFLSTLLYRASKVLLASDELTWEELRGWIAKASDRNNFGRGFSGSRLPPAIGHGFVEIRREAVADGRYRVIASVVFNPRQGVAVSRTWEAKRLDGELAGAFGRNLRIRLDI
ncbi:hypothetical protein [Pandoraea soli]